ncbi:MAG TPA: DUF2147 domain-containing protein [Nitrospirota bacterium]|nr:DUF2147 domain-containing protein [Nitrospirota bacterium]
MKYIIIIILAGMIPMTAIPAYAAGSDDILGVWNNEEKDAKIEIYKCGVKYCGKIIWLKEPNYPEGSKDGTPGAPRLDHHNPDPSLRKVLIIGLNIVHDFTTTDGHIWFGGTIYDPKSGKTYRGKMTLVSPNQLSLRGYVGIPLFGRSTTWTK